MSVRLGADPVFGPVHSRRYQRALDVSLAPPGRKACRWSCVYCQLGHSRGLPRDAEFPSAREVAESLARASAEEVDAIVLCGNGEPTLHPRFPEVVEELVRVRDARLPGVPIVCLTSGSELGRHDVVEALRVLDECAVKLDAGRCATLRRIALSDGPVCVEWLTWRIRALADAVVQACFFDGPVSNSSDAEIEAWTEAVRACEPRRVDVFTIERPPPSAHLRPVAAARLLEIAGRLRAVSRVPVRAIS